MARIQILELPTIYREGGDDETPFVIVVDQAVPQRAVIGVDQPWVDYWQEVADKAGARAVIVTPETVEIPANSHIAYSGEVMTGLDGPDFSSPIAGRVEVRSPRPAYDA
ncbi:hypothetical protein ACH4GK_31795 [Streptomyces rimosus]|uniref:hypothetical protein n=1 Tax=Streptomyces rimosus TaxID=1927 RepID=UPI00067D978B|nr:hypothetical protein [Streptomyces rimosus]